MYGNKFQLIGSAASGLALLLGLSACGGGSSSGTASPTAVTEAPRYLVGGTVSGLVPGTQLVLANGADKLTVTANGSFSFSNKLPAGASYEGKIAATSEGLSCRIANAAAVVANADVSTLAVHCLPVVLAGVPEKIQYISGMAQDTAGNYYFADSILQVIHKMRPDGTLSLYAGMPGKAGADDGIASKATFHMDAGTALLTIDRDANLYLSDNCNGLLRKIGVDGMVSTVAGQRSLNCEPAAAQPLAADGQGVQARLGSMGSIAMDRNGDVLFADTQRTGMHRVTPAGVVSTEKYTYVWTPDVSGADQSVGQIAVDASGTIYFSNRDGNLLFRLRAGVASLVAGSYSRTGADGKGTGASFQSIQAMVADQEGNLLLSDADVIRRMTPDGSVTTLVGRSVADAAGTLAGWDNLGPLMLENSGAALVFDASNHRLTRFDTARLLTNLPVLPGNTGPKDGIGAAARLGYVSASGMCSDPDGNIYLIDASNKVLRRVTADGQYSLYAGSVGRTGSTDGPLAGATVMLPVAIACGQDGTVYFADQAPATRSLMLRKISKDGVVSTEGVLPIGLGLNSGYVLAVDKEGYISWQGRGLDGIYRRAPGGTFSRLISFETLIRAQGLADYSWEFMASNSMVFDSKGNLYFDDAEHHVVFKTDRAGQTSIFAGTFYTGSATSGVGPLPFSGSASLATDAADNLYLSGQGGVLKMDTAGVISTPQLAWGNPEISVLASGKDTLYGFTLYAIVQTFLP